MSVAPNVIMVVNGKLNSGVGPTRYRILVSMVITITPYLYPKPNKLV